jgi:hypothetical protein
MEGKPEGDDGAGPNIVAALDVAGAVPNGSTRLTVWRPSPSTQWRITVTDFRVWLSPLGATCKVRVDGIDNANWLVNGLRQSFVFESSEPVSDLDGTGCCTFDVVYCSPACFRTLERLLTAIPEVEVTLDLARQEERKNALAAPRKTQARPFSDVRWSSQRLFSPPRRASQRLLSTPITGAFNWFSSKLSGAVATILRTGS